MKFFERKEIKDVLAYCRMIVNPRDDEAVLRVINVPKRNIGDTVVEQYRAYCAERSYTLLEPLMSGLEECDLPAATIKKLAVFRDLYMDLHGKYRILKASDMVEYIINSTGIKKSYEGDDEENYNHRMNLDELVNTVKTYEKENGEVDLCFYVGIHRQDHQPATG